MEMTVGGTIFKHFGDQKMFWFVLFKIGCLVNRGYVRLWMDDNATDAGIIWMAVSKEKQVFQINDRSVSQEMVTGLNHGGWSGWLSNKQ